MIVKKFQGLKVTSSTFQELLMSQKACGLPIILNSSLVERFRKWRTDFPGAVKI